MRLHRVTRRRLCLWQVLALLLVQWASATYVCPALAAGVPQRAASSAMVLMPGCDGQMFAGAASGSAMDPDQPLLCQAQCHPVAQALGAASLDQSDATPPLLLAVLDWAPWAVLPPQSRSAEAVRPHAAAPPGALALVRQLPVLRR